MLRLANRGSFRGLGYVRGEMKTMSHKKTRFLAGILVYTSFSLSAAAQTSRPAEQAFKNIKVLTGVPESQIQPTMWFFSAALGVRCRFCHEDENDKREMDTKPQKAVARKMIEMTMAINKNSFGGRTVVTCNSCHRGNAKPVGSPAIGIDTSLATRAEAVGKPIAADPMPTLDQLIGKYETASGGAATARQISSLAMKGTVVDTNFNGERKTMPVDIVAKGPAFTMVTAHDHDGDSISTINGSSGWIVTENRPARDMRPTEFEAAKLEDPNYVTGRVKQVFTELRFQSRLEKIDGRDAYIVSGRSPGSTAVRLYFDKESGMLMRLVYDTETVFGPYYTRIDYADYRNSDGLQVPYHWKISRVRGEVSEYQVSELKLNVPVNEASFAKPSAPPAAK